MNTRCLHWFCLTLLVMACDLHAANELKTGSAATLRFDDVDGHTLSTADGHVTIITVVSRENEAKARAIADQVPERYIGDQKYRYVTLVNFEKKLPAMLRGVTRGVIRGRLDAEARELKPRYDAKHIARDPRGDVYVIADFDGKAVTQLGLQLNAGIACFVFNGQGRLIESWREVPPAGALPRAILAAE